MRIAAAMSLVALLAGCNQATPFPAPADRLARTIYDDVYFPETDKLVFEEALVRVDAGRRYELIAHGRRSIQRGPALGEVYFLRLHVTWPVVPSRNSPDRSVANAAFELLSMSLDNPQRLHGSGFVFVRKNFDGTTSFEIEQARLMPPAEPRQPAPRIKEVAIGTIVAKSDAQAFSDLRMRMDQCRRLVDEAMSTPPAR
jgi:hypothetical protein